MARNHQSRHHRHRLGGLYLSYESSRLCHLFNTSFSSIYVFRESQQTLAGDNFRRDTDIYSAVVVAYPDGQFAMIRKEN